VTVVSTTGLLAVGLLLATPAAGVAQATKIKITVEDGKLVFSFDLKVRGRPGVEEVQVDARTGAIVSVEHESAAAEAKEKKPR